MAHTRPPLGDVPLFAPCPRCRGVLRARVDLRVDPVVGALDCPWCRQPVRVHPPR